MQCCTQIAQGINNPLTWFVAAYIAAAIFTGRRQNKGKK